MAKGNGFEFKCFYVAHDKCAMKVGTDGVLLGAWTRLEQVEKVLDIGCGSGLLSLMLAQRLSKQQQEFTIQAIDIDESAVEQSKFNFQQSSWKERLSTSLASLTQQRAMLEYSFDLIISNPPYFLESLQTPDEQRQKARHLSHQNEISNHLQWLEHCARFVTKSGRIALVLPYTEGIKLLSQIEGIGLVCVRYCEVITKEGKEPRRVLLEFSKYQQVRLSSTKNSIDLVVSKLVIYNKNNQYTDSFKELTKDFYLNF